MQTGVAKGLKVPCLFMIAEVNIRCQKNPGGWYTPYTRVYPPIHHWCLALARLTITIEALKERQSTSHTHTRLTALFRE